MADFAEFAALVGAQFASMSKHELFTTRIDNDTLWAQYLAAFPEGTDPLYITNTEHNCSCCRNFIKNIGDLVTIQNGKVTTIWDIQGAEYPYNVVAETLANIVSENAVNGIFRSSERKYGNESNIQRKDDGSTINWHHFEGIVASRHFTEDVGQQRGDYATTVKVFARGLDELTPEAFDTVIGLIEAKALYRGEEFLPAIREFQKVQREYLKLHVHQREYFVWEHAAKPVARFRNTAIGTLLQDLSANMPLEEAVKAFESKVAPENYKRTTALITPRMIQDAVATINELGLEPALERRLARISDISVNNVLWVDSTVRSKMKGGLQDLLMAAVEPKLDTASAVDITIDDFMQKVIPEALSMEIKVTNAMQPNFVTLTAPVHADPYSKLFKWDNDFAWSYDGNVTDSIKEKVKRAGGKIEADMRVSLAWSNYDDLDIHILEPDGYHIYFGNKGRRSANGGMLDVDMNMGHGTTRTPVENVTWNKPKDGQYRVIVNQYCRRETCDYGFTIEIENAGKVTQLTSGTSPARGDVEVAILHVKKGVIEKIDFDEKLYHAAGIAQQKWGITTESFVKVSTLMRSPNHWDDNKVGNKHWFFMLDGCRTDEPARGIYTEFLRSDLEKHRKVFEVLGNKTKCQPTDDQLSGVGFSSTRNDTVHVCVGTQKSSRLYNIIF